MKDTAARSPVEAAAEMRKEFPTTLLAWGDAVRLLVRLGLGRYDMEQWSEEDRLAVEQGKDPTGFRRLVGGRKRYLYSREFILRRALSDNGE